MCERRKRAPSLRCGCLIRGLYRYRLQQASWRVVRARRKARPIRAARARAGGPRGGPGVSLPFRDRSCGPVRVPAGRASEARELTLYANLTLIKL